MLLWGSEFFFQLIYVETRCTFFCHPSLAQRRAAGLYVTLIFLLFADPIIHCFTKDEVVAAYGVQSLRIIGTGFIFYGIGMVLTQALNGAGDSKTPTVINLICFWVFQIPFAYLLAKGFQLGTTGAFIAVPITQAMVTLLGWF